MKKLQKILAILLCFCCLFFVGCGTSGLSKEEQEELNKEIENGEVSDKYMPEVLAMDGAKVLSRPSGYDFQNAVGEDMTINYYNLLASEILKDLYLVYENPNNALLVNELKGKFYGLEENGRYTKIDEANGLTYTNATPEDEIYYLYDSLRYTISKITEVYKNETAEGGNTTKTLSGFIIELDLNSTWQWSIPIDANYTLNEIKEGKEQAKADDDANRKIVFFAIPKDNKNYEFKDSKTTIAFTYADAYSLSEIYSISPRQIPAFPEIYYNNNGGDNVEVDENGKITGTVDYQTSPYYFNNVETDKEGKTVPVNYFQDALEYAIYMTVLGFDFESDKDKDYFDFKVVHNKGSGVVEDILVDGWGKEKLSISKANDANGNQPILERVKKAYENKGNYIGITKENKQKIISFIKNIIIGDKATAKNTFRVEFKERNDTVNADGTVTEGTPIKSTTKEDLKFNRNYDKIIKNIVEYACEQAPIGIDEGGDPIRCDQPYAASLITDYRMNAFFVNDDDEDAHWFDDISAAEYQSIVVYPPQENIGKTLGDIWLAFEYFGDAADGYLPYIDIVVGVRYWQFDETTGEGKLLVGGEDNKAEETKRIYNVKLPIDEEDFMDYPEDERMEAWETAMENSMMFMSHDGEDPATVGFGNDIKLTKFNKDIGDGVINPFVKGTMESVFKASMPIYGNRAARNYYKLNKSSLNGFYGTLNETMFAGDDGCSFIEIYFDIQKHDNLLSNTKYDFKVGFLNFAELYDEEMPNWDY